MTSTYAVAGMTCEHCVRSVTEEVSEVPGVTAVEVDLAPFFAVAHLLYGGAWVAERYQAIRPFIETRPEALHPVTAQIAVRTVCGIWVEVQI